MQLLFRRTVSRLRANDLLRKAVSRARTLGFGRDYAALERARKHIEVGNFNLAASQLETINNKKLRAWRTLLSCYFTAHRYEEVVSSYESMPGLFTQDYACRQFYLFAAANLKRFEAVAQTIASVLNEPNSLAAADFLSKVRPFAERMGIETHRAVVSRIIAQQASLAEEQFDVILKCAHDLREIEWRAEAGELEGALRQVANSRGREMKLDIFDAQLHFWSRRYDLQLAAVNAVLSKQGLSSLELKNEMVPFTCTNLQAPLRNPTLHGPLVSILMPAFNSATTISDALESLCNQTYRNIEVIVVDDASADETAGVVSRFSAVDPRVRLLSLDKNSGAFVARNTALASASGEFVTNQDADDWAHPEKIATAVAELQRDQSIVATWVEHVRCSGHRGFRALNGYFRPDASSMMFRRKPVSERVGWYDSVRAAGDGEFHLRIERIFGVKSIRRINKLLSIVSWTDDSLSGGGAFQIDSDLGIFSPARSAYRRSFGYWHETAHSLYMPFPLETRLFPAPDSLISQSARAPNSNPVPP